MKDNMFNIKQPEYTDCSYHSENSKIYLGDSSYIPSVKWLDFIYNPDSYIDKAVNIAGEIEMYDITKVVI